MHGANMPCERLLLFEKVTEIFIFVVFVYQKNKSGRRKVSFFEKNC